MNVQELKQTIRTVRGFPKPGINFRDVTPVFEAPAVFQKSIDALCAWARDKEFGVLAGIDARGFLLAGAMAVQLNLPLVLVRKKGKLPADTLAVDYALEYGQATIEVHRTDICQDQAVLIVDDLLATGGTALATAHLLRQLGAARLGFGALINLMELPGAAKLAEQDVTAHCLCEFNESE